MTPGGPPRVCPACGVAPRRGLTLRNGAALLGCSRCGLGWWDWPAFEPAEFYDRDYFQSPKAGKGYDDYAALEPAARRTARARLRRIRRLLARTRPGGEPRRLLELGCGTGCFLDEARAAGWSARGLEVSPYAARVAGDRRLDVTCAGVEAASRVFAGQRADCVALWDVLEHVCDPRATLRDAGALLEPGGVLALSTGDLHSLCARLSGRAWHLFNLPEHLYFFTPTCLKRLLAAAGLRRVTVTREINWIPLHYAAERLRKSLGLRARPGTARGAPIDRLALPATLLDVIGCYAVRG